MQDQHVTEALRVWNSKQPAWKPVLRFDQLTASQKSVVEDLAENIRKDLQASQVVLG